MNHINRSLVKSQARQIIKGKVFYLFIITIVVTTLTGGVTSAYNLGNNLREEFWNIYNSANESSNDNYGYYGDFDDYFERNFGDGNNPFDDFEYTPSSADSTAIIGGADSPTAIFTTRLPFAFAGVGMFSGVAAFVLAPLGITLAGMYVSLIRRNANERFEFGKEFGGIFKNTFNDTFANKLVLNILVGLITFALFLLFIIPGIIFSFSAYFSNQIMCDYPNLKPSEAIKLSKKIVRGNRTELFTLNISFIGWYLLMAITFGIAGIYVLPYVETTKALYYENFRLRALAEGRITEDDFLSEQERMMKYNGFNMNNTYQQGYYAPEANAQQSAPYQPYQTAQQIYVNNNGTFYTPDFSPIQQYPQYNMSQPYQQHNGSYYYTPQPPQYEQPQPPQNEQPVQPAEPQYYNPVEPAQPAEPQYYNPTEPAQPTEPQYYTPPTEETTENTDADDNH